MSKDFEAMKAGKSPIRPWLSCPYNEHTFVDLPSSVGDFNKMTKKQNSNYSINNTITTH